MFVYRERVAERTRIARELHDTLLQSLAGVSLQLDGISKRAPSEPGAVPEMIGHVREQVDACFSEAREKVWDLRSPPSDGQGLADRLREFCSRTAEQGAPCRFSLSGISRECASQVEEEFFRIAQEATHNAIRHAAAKEIRILLQYRARSLRLQISDDGCGFDLMVGDRKSGHWGLKTMRERAATIHAKFRIDTAPGQGTDIEVFLPLSLWRTKASLWTAK